MIGKKLLVELGAELFPDPFPHQLVRPGGIERLRHIDGDAKGVRLLPRLRLVTENQELDGEAAAMARDERVHSACVSAQESPRLGVKLAHRPLGELAETESPALYVEPQDGLTEDFGELTLHKTPAHVHLPQPVLSRHITLGEEQILEGLGADVWRAVGVAQDLDGASKPGQAQRSVELRQAGVAPPVKPDYS